MVGGGVASLALEKKHNVSKVLAAPGLRVQRPALK